VLFVGVATSIAALPMLAAIGGERGLARTTAGAIATAATGLVDVLAWLALAAPLIGTVRHRGNVSPGLPRHVEPVPVHSSSPTRSQVRKKVKTAQRT
jgi:hypothetical protein